MFASTGSGETGDRLVETVFDVNVEYDSIGSYIKMTVDAAVRPKPIHARNHRSRAIAARRRPKIILQIIIRPVRRRLPVNPLSRVRPAKNHFINGALSVIYCPPSLIDPRCTTLVKMWLVRWIFLKIVVPIFWSFLDNMRDMVARLKILNCSS